MDLPDQFLEQGTIMYQWATFDDREDPDAITYTVACKTMIGDPGATEIELFVRETSMGNDSEAVAGKRWWEQNASNNYKGHAYKSKSDNYYLLRDSEDYTDSN